MTTMCKVAVPPAMAARMEELKDSPEEVLAYGEDFIVQMMTQLQEAGVKQFHIYTLNQDALVTRILRRLDLLQEESPKSASLPSTAPTSPSNSP